LGCPPYSLEVSVASPLDLAKKSSVDVSAWTSCGVPNFFLFSKWPVSCTPAWGFLNGMLILSANPTVKTSELS
jgi:hypothetical protein